MVAGEGKETPEMVAARSKYPPGTVLNPDGTPCKICTSSAAWSAFAGKTKKKIPKTGTAAAAGAGAAATTLASVDTTGSTASPTDCPPDVEQLGRHTWTFLHTTASYFPPAPSAHQRTSMLSLLNALPTLYPCGMCADELGKYIQQHPPEQAVNGGRTSLELWLCQVHNEVNQRLGKTPFDCDNVGQRWRDGWTDGRCD
ncbi:BZ3500_MvSof-1268-A1-R1_Chr2-3g05225 [Microbotryum saponariae]|uniref:Sulfhydryl oxidase n=1 Tax=Microbotryum saponariae TaxID=289078 RepID=A0A2X0L397_9BASI|nr:BZ3500_MvSof-1268-A1-R1_Chr2-3g05225 [Microbotryum saponariae]SDA01051.1 BZ3501_MvSof-1269-A2-R1_Chr2-2g04898 [Microbotryum saponariae]